MLFIGDAMPDKVLSFILPSYNMEKYLPGCVDSIMAAEDMCRDKVEVLIVNDGSKDGTVDVARCFERRYPECVHVIDKPNGHYGSCVNAGLEVAKGLFVKILDADDSVDTCSLECFVKGLEKCSGEPVDVVFSDFVLVQQGRTVEFRISASLPEDKTFAIDTLVASGAKMTMHTITYRAELLRRIGYRQTEGMPYTDNEWALLPMRFARAMRYVKVPLYRYLVGREGQSVSAEQSTKNISHLEVMLAHMMNATHDFDADSLFRKYASRFVFDSAALVYKFALLYLPVRIGVEKVGLWEERLRSEEPECYGALAGLCLRENGWPRFRYVQSFRRWSGLRFLSVRFFRLANGLINCVRCAKVRLRDLLGEMGIK